jgi:hypothetical protein
MVRKADSGKDFVVQLTSPFTKQVWNVSHKGKTPFMTFKDAENMFRKVVPKYPVKTYKTTVRKVGFVDKVLRL